MDAGDKFDVARFGSPSESAGSNRDRDRGPPPRYGDRETSRKSTKIIYPQKLVSKPLISRRDWTDNRKKCEQITISSVFFI